MSSAVVVGRRRQSWLRRTWHDHARVWWKDWYRDARDRLLVGGLARIRRLAARVGFEGVRRFAERLLATAGPLLAGPRRRALGNLAFALPDLAVGERVRIVHQMFRGLALSVAELLVLDEIAHDVDRWVEADGLEVMDAALAEGNGVIAVTGHIGNWELLAAYFGLKGYPVTVIATPVKGERLGQANVDLRRSVNVETIWRDAPGAPREILRTLKGGRILAILMDQNTRGQNVEVPFFGALAPTPIGPAALSLRTGAPVVGVFIHRQEDGTHRVRVTRPELPEPPLARAMGRDAWHTEVTARLTALIEGEVRNRPDEWVWWHRRWS